MMKYSLLLILSFLLYTSVNSFPVVTNSKPERIGYTLPVAESKNNSSLRKDSISSPDHKFIEILLHGFVVSRKDSFPIQAGAFKIRSNADRFYNNIKKISGIDAKIIEGDGFYKVRISGYPYSARDNDIKASASKQESIYENEEKLKELLLKGYLISRKDSFPIQVGAFKIKENADRFYNAIRKISGIYATIVYKNSFYNIRITRYPDTNGYAQTSKVHYSEKNLTRVENVTAGHEQIFFTDLNDFIRAYKFLPPSAGPVTQKEVKPGENSTWQERIRYFGESYLLVKALLVSILFFIGSMMILLVIIYLQRKKISSEQTRHQYLSEKYQTLIVNYLFGDPNVEEFRAIASDRYSRQILIDQMVDVSINLKGEEADKLTGLYRYLGLSRDSLDRAMDPRWHKKIKGFRELAFMNIRDANELMYKALDSSNDILRMEAQIALVRLSDKDPFEFLSRLDKPFSLWEQITLHNIIVQHNIKEPSFKQWLSSPNFTVVLFALRMIREFRQMDAEEEVRNTLLHHSPEVRLLAVQVAGDLGMSSTLETMKQIYEDQDNKISLEILRSMGKMPSVTMIGFLKNVLDKEEDVQLQIEATKSIEKMGEEGINVLLEIMKSGYKNYNIIVKHVLDKRIN